MSQNKKLFIQMDKEKKATEKDEIARETFIYKHNKYKVFSRRTLTRFTW